MCPEFSMLAWKLSRSSNRLLGPRIVDLGDGGEAIASDGKFQKKRTEKAKKLVSLLTADFLKKKKYTEANRILVEWKQCLGRSVPNPKGFDFELTGEAL